MNDKWTYKWSQCDMNYFDRYSFFVIFEYIVIVIDVWWWLRWILDNETSIQCIRSLVFDISERISNLAFRTISIGIHALIIQLLWNYLFFCNSPNSQNIDTIIRIKYCYDASTILVRYETTSPVMMTTEIYIILKDYI